MSSQNEAHGDEDHVEPPTQAEIEEVANEIITDGDFLKKHIEDAPLALSLAGVMSHIDKACNGDVAATAAVLRYCHLLQKALREYVRDAAVDLANERLEP